MRVERSSTEGQRRLDILPASIVGWERLHHAVDLAFDALKRSETPILEPALGLSLDSVDNSAMTSSLVHTNLNILSDGSAVMSQLD